MSAGVRPTTRDMGSNGQIFLGDIILAMDNVPTPSTQALLAQMDKKRYPRLLNAHYNFGLRCNINCILLLLFIRVGQKITLHLQRDRKRVDVAIILQERKRSQ